MYHLSRVMKVFAKKIKEARGKADMTQHEVAAELKVSLQCYKNYEAGRRVPDLETATKISIILGVSLDKLVGKT